LALALTAPLFAHGGVFPPVPPKPPDPPVPGASTPSVPPPSRPTTPGPVGRAPSTPSQPTSPGPSTPGRPLTPAPGSVATDSWAFDLTSWRAWWRFNQDEFVELQAHLDHRDLTTGSEQFFDEHDSGDRRASGPRDIAERIVPALLAALRRESTVDVKSSALIALGRVGERTASDGSAPHAAAITPFLRDRRQEVAESAALSLGILGSPSPRVADLLARVALDDRGALERLHGLAFAEPLSERTRAFATFGLGLLGERVPTRALARSLVAALREVAKRARAEHSRELCVAAATALGLVQLPLRRAGDPPAEPSSARALEDELDWLYSWYADEHEQEVVRAHLPIALARLVDSGRVEGPWRERIARRLLADLGAPNRTPPLVQRSAAQALGRIGRASGEALDVEIRAGLFAALESRELFVRRFALMALARSGSTARDGFDLQPASDEVRARLIAELSAGKGGTASWAALALGVLERRLQRAGAPAAPRTVAVLLDARKAARASEDRGALALALGLCGDATAREPLRLALAEERNPETQGDLALALGLLGDRDAIEPIRAVLARARYQPSLLLSAALGLGLVGDVRAVPTLIDLLERSTTLAAQGAVASALGLVGDSRSVEPLVALASREDIAEGARAFAVVALGLVGDQAALPWRASLARDFNYTAGTSTLVMPETATGVLDIL
jgi:HEAT repeat protein